jgi:hypothetical protein
VTRAGCVVLGLLLAATAAHADVEPWKRGVTPERMRHAQELLEAGNAVFLERDYAASLAKYQEAIAVWDHPAIRFNMVRALIHLDRVVEAFDNLELALAHGPAPLEENVYVEAIAYQKLLANQIGKITVRCTQPGVEVTLDGQPLLTCPGSEMRRVRPGNHQVVGKHPELLTRSTEVFVAGGTTETVAFALDPPGTDGVVIQRWSTWIPWVVVAGGAALTGTGALVQTLAISDRDRYYTEVASNCAPAGCPDSFAADIRDRAQLENRVAIGLVAAGVATLVTGGVMVYMNRARLEPRAARASVAPSPGGASVLVQVPF